MLFTAVVLVLAGCAQAPRGGSSDPAFVGAAAAQSSGSGSSDIEDYRQVLSDPGPF